MENHQMKTRNFALKIMMLLTMFLTTSCATYDSVRLPLEAPLKNRPLKIFSLVDQNQLLVQLPSNGGEFSREQGGVVGGLLQSYIDNETKKIAERLLSIERVMNNSLPELHFREKLISSLNNDLSKNKNFNSIEIISVDSYEKIEKQVRSGEIFGVIKTGYFVRTDLISTFIFSNVSLLEKSAKDTKKLYNNSFTYYTDYLFNMTSYATGEKHDLTTRLVSEDQFKDKWNSSAAQYLAKDITKGINAITKLISEDINDATPNSDYSKQAKAMEGYHFLHKTTLISETEDKLVVRYGFDSREGHVCSMPKYNIKQNIPPLCFR